MLHRKAIALHPKNAIAFPPSTSIRVHLRLLKRAIALTTKRAIALNPCSSTFICGKKKCDRPSIMLDLLSQTIDQRQAALDATHSIPVRDRKS
jgi:hypothetical protein